MAKKKLNKTRKTIDDAYQIALELYAERDYITGIDIGFKYKRGEVTDQLSIRFHVREKMPKSALESADIFPREIEGFPVDVIEGEYATGAVAEATMKKIDRTRRFKTLQPGISVGHTDVTAGTLGMFVEDKLSGAPAILSNWHVLAGSEKAASGDTIVQPAPHDGGSAKKDAIATLERMMLDADGDAAIALVNNKRNFNPSVLELNVVPESVDDPQIGDAVVKSGRTTQVTSGKVDGKGRYFIYYPVGRVGIDGFIIVPHDKTNRKNIELSMGGDSGSVWLKENSATVLGLHFAGETNPRASEEHAIACYATRVFERLQIQPFCGD